MNDQEFYDNAYNAAVYYVYLTLSTYPTQLDFVLFETYNFTDVSIISWNSPTIQPSIATLKTYTVAQVQRSATEFYAQLEGTKLGVDLYISSSISINLTSYKDIGNMAIRTIDSNNFLMQSNLSVLIYNPGSYAIDGRLNITVSSGTATTYNITHRLVYSTDAVNYNDLYPQPATMTLTANRISTNNNNFISIIPIIYNTNYANTYIKMQAKTSNTTMTTNTIPLSTGIAIKKLESF